MPQEVQTLASRLLKPVEQQQVEHGFAPERNNFIVQDDRPSSDRDLIPTLLLSLLVKSGFVPTCYNHFNSINQMKPKLGEDIIKAYEPYRNEKAKWKTSIISNQKFEIYDRYEIVDTSMI
jgi:hypothetical protein